MPYSIACYSRNTLTELQSSTCPRKQTSRWWGKTVVIWYLFSMLYFSFKDNILCMHSNSKKWWWRRLYTLWLSSTADLLTGNGCNVTVLVCLDNHWGCRNICESLLRLIYLCKIIVDLVLVNGEMSVIWYHFGIKLQEQNSLNCNLTPIFAVALFCNTFVN